MSKHGRPSDDSPVDIDRHHHQPIVQVTNGSIAGIGIVGKKHIALFDSALVALLESPEERTELTDNHLPFLVSDHREGVMLLANSRGHRSSKKNGIHFSSRITECILDNIERYCVYAHIGEWRIIGLNDLSRHLLLLYEFMRYLVESKCFQTDPRHLYALAKPVSSNPFQSQPLGHESDRPT